MTQTPRAPLVPVPVPVAPTESASRSGSAGPEPLDRRDQAHVDLVRGAPDRLRRLGELGVLGAGSIHLATLLADRLGETDPDVVLAVALVARAGEQGHTCLDLKRVTDVVVGREGLDEEVDRLVWPDPARWRSALSASALVEDVDDATVADDDASGDPAPLVLDASRLHLRRHHQQEVRIAGRLRDAIDSASGQAADAESGGDVESVLRQVFGADGPGATAAAGNEEQWSAVRSSLTHDLTVLAGGPGTGKTWTIARAVAANVLAARRDGRTLHVALAAPTGKAAARLRESLEAAVAGMTWLDRPIRDRVLAARPSTLHRLLGWHPGARHGFRHGPDDPLPHDLVVVDEVSMTSIKMVDDLIGALRPGTRLVLVGDPNQLVSVEAGSVLADLLDDRASLLEGARVVLDRVYRYPDHSGIAALSTAIRRQDTDAATAAMAGHDDVTLLDHDDEEALALVAKAARSAASARRQAARTGDAGAAVAALTGFQVLCAHRRGDDGVAGWNARVARWIDDDPWATVVEARPGTPLLVTRNDASVGVSNGDLGVVVLRDGRRVAAFPDADGAVREVPLARLSDTGVVHAMTIHKSQGSEFDHVVCVLPREPSRIVTQELLYTAVTRARERVTIVASPASLQAAIEHRVVRASGLAPRLGRTAADGRH